MCIEMRRSTWGFFYSWHTEGKFVMHALCDTLDELCCCCLFGFERNGEGFRAQDALSQPDLVRPLEDSPPWNIQCGRRPSLKHRWSDTSRTSDVWTCLRVRLELRKNTDKKKNNSNSGCIYRARRISCRHPSKSFLRQMKGWICTLCDAASFPWCHFSLSASPTSLFHALH